MYPHVGKSVDLIGVFLIDQDKDGLFRFFVFELFHKGDLFRFYAEVADDDIIGSAVKELQGKINELISKETVIEEGIEFDL